MPGPEQLASLGLREVTGEPGAGDVSLTNAVVTDESSETVATGQEVQRRAARQSKSVAGKSEPPPEPFFLSEGLPPIPAKLVAKIQRGDFVDMADLLRDNIEAARRQYEEEAPRCSNELRKPRREVPDFLSWVQCFGVFASIVAAKHPERFKALMAYQTLMVREARRCGGLGWLTYDTMFRQQAANSTGVDWTKLNTSLYAVTFLQQHSGRGHTCSHCLETDHEAAACALAPARAGTQLPVLQAAGSGWMYPGGGYEARRPGDRENPLGLLGSAPPELRRVTASVGQAENRRPSSVGGRANRPARRLESAGPPPKRLYCFQWNEGSCDLYRCRFRHACMRCGGEHRLMSCTKKVEKTE